MRTARIVVAALALTLLSACTSGQNSAPAPSGASVTELAGTSWNLTAYADADGAQTPAVTDPSVGTLNFLADGQLAGSTGCNRFSGTYAQSGEDLAITTELITAAACIGPAGEQDPAVIAALDKVATAGVAADQLVLKDGQGAQLLVHAPGQAGLQGTSWTATWTTTEPDGLTIGPIGAQLVACEQEVQDTENQYFAALAKVATYQFEGNQLTLSDAQGAVQVSFVLAAD